MLFIATLTFSPFIRLWLRTVVLTTIAYQLGVAVPTVHMTE